MNEEKSLREIRIDKLARLREIGQDPYQAEKFEFDRSAGDLVENFEAGTEVKFAGRVVSYRLMGKAGFAHLSDGDAKIQAYFKKDDIGEIGWEVYNLLDIGDHVGVSGVLQLTKTGEKTIFVSTLAPLSKALQPVPVGKEKDGQVFSGLSDVEQRYRHRHLDLLANADARKMLIDRARIVSSVRNYFNGNGYLEVETPLLQLIAGGAAASPFMTHYNAYDTEVKLRISLELYLKRIICGDIPRVYEVGRVFRNEGVSNRHNPEFTLLEFYEAYANLEDMMSRVEECFKFVALQVFGKTTVEIKRDNDESVVLDFGKPWKRVDLLTEIERLSGMTPADLADLATAQAALRDKNIPEKALAAGGRIDIAKENNLGGLIEKLLEVFVEPMLEEPTFVVGYPIETSPLAKKDPSNPKMTRRFEGYVLKREVCNAFSEINDPIDQRERFEQQLDKRENGDDEAHPMDEDFIYALECGMPPTGGCGIGLDRMAMLLTGADTIREVLFFPMMKPASNNGSEANGSEALILEAD